MSAPSNSQLPPATRNLLARVLRMLASAFRMEPFRLMRWEMAFMRVFFACVVWRSIPRMIPFETQPYPNGPAIWFDLTFLANQATMDGLYWGLIAAMVCYICGYLMLPALGYMLFLSVATSALLNSQGAIGHTFQIVSLALLAQVLAWSWSAWKRLTGHRFPSPADSERLSVNWTRQTIVATYVVSAITKLINSNGTWLWDTPNFALQIVKSNGMNYYNSLEPAARGAMEDFSQILLSHPWLAIPFIGSGLILELFAFIGLLNRRTAFWTGALLILFHSTVSVIMSLDFLFNKYLLAIYLCNIPYWIWRCGGWIQRTPAIPAGEPATAVPA